jgi:hypothetical protein
MPKHATILALGAAMLLAGCTETPQTKPVRLRHSQTGTVVTCGPYDNRPSQSAASVLRERGCIDDFQRQGYERIADE